MTKSYKIIDSEGKTVDEGYKSKQAGKNEIHNFKLHRRDILEVVEE